MKLHQPCTFLNLAWLAVGATSTSPFIPFLIPIGAYSRKRKYKPNISTCKLLVEPLLHKLMSAVPTSLHPLSPMTDAITVSIVPI